MRFGEFPSLSNLVSFLVAKEYRNANNLAEKANTNVVEKLAGRLLTPIQLPSHGLLSSYDQPIMITVVTVAGIGLWTLFNYPQQVLEKVQFVCSPFFDFEPWMVRFSWYILSQTMLAAFWMRSVARLRDGELTQKWHSQQIVPFHLGSLNRR